jgi:hypothetical protein
LTLTRWISLAGWIFVAVLLLMQFGLFRQHALRNVVWSYPPNHDQVNFLEQSYIGYEKVLELGPRKGFEKELNLKPPRQGRRPGVVVLPKRPNDLSDPPPVTRAVGMMLPLQTTTLYFLAGPGRLTALSLNFVYFAIFQAALVGALRWLTGRWSVAFIGLGLLLCALTPFFWAGGITDFRLDFISFCLFGTFICAVMRSRVFADRKWAIVAGLAGALLFTFRFITLVYLGGALGFLALFLAVRMRWGAPGSAPRRRSARQLRNAMIASGIIACVAVPVIAQRWRAIKEYYVVGHVTGREKEVRAREQGVTTWREALLFYPQSLRENHSGPHLLQWGGYVLVAGLAAFLLRFSMRGGKQPPALFDVPSACVFVGACLMVPLLVLTSDTAKSPVVADIMVAGVVWLVLLGLIVLAGMYRRHPAHRAVSIGLIVLAALVMRAGILVQFDRYLRRPPAWQNRPEIEKLLALYDRVADDASAMGWRAPSFAFDSSSDALNFKVFDVMVFERRGQVFTPSEVLANTIFLRNPGELEHRLACADFAILTQVAPDRPLPPYEFDRGMAAMKPALFAWCRLHLIELQHEHLGLPFDRDVTLFVRPAVRVQGERDGWIARRGTRITGLAEVLRAKPDIVLRGKNAASSLRGGVPRASARIVGDGKPIDVPARLTNDADEYALELRLDPKQLPEQGPVTIELTFDASFLPRQVNGSPDGRELVMRLPEDGSLAPSNPPTKEASAGR